MMTVEQYLKERCERVRSNESISYVELMMDNHKCVEYGGRQYYVPEEGNHSKEYKAIYDFLVDNYHV